MRLLLLVTCLQGLHAGTVGAQARGAPSPQPKAGSEPYREAIRKYLAHEEPKIIGGKLAPPGTFPWQVSLSVASIPNPLYAHFCGGSVYSASWIVTAAHCVTGNATSDITVIAGTHKLGVGDVRAQLARIFIRTDYNSATKDNDVALLQLASPLHLGADIQPVPLVNGPAEDSVLRKNVTLFVVGWGATREGGKVVSALRYVALPFVARTDCNLPQAYNGRITESMLCAGMRSGTADACQGDSGGPLTVGTAISAKLVGIVSWGEGCGEPNKVGIYARVPKYSEWIATCVAKPEECH